MHNDFENVVSGSAASPTAPDAPEVAQGEQNKDNARRILLARLGLDSKRKRLLAAIAAVAAAIVAVAGILVWYLIFRSPISELPGLNVTVAPTYSFSISGVSRPLGVAVDEENNRLYVTQSSGSRTVRVFDLEGNAIQTLQTPEQRVDHTPTYVAVNPTNHEVVVSDRSSNSVYIYDKTGKFVGTIAPHGVKHWAPLALAFDREGHLFVADVSTAAAKIFVLNSDGSVLRTLGATAGLSFPNGIAVRDNGTLLVADSNNSRVLVLDANGAVTGGLARGSADSPMGLPRGLALGAKSQVYVVDTVNDVVRIYRGDDTPEYATSFGRSGALDGTFRFPNGIATDAHGHVYVTDRGNDRVEVWTSR